MISSCHRGDLSNRKCLPTAVLLGMKLAAFTGERQPAQRVVVRRRNIYVPTISQSIGANVAMRERCVPLLLRVCSFNYPCQSTDHGYRAKNPTRPSGNDGADLPMSFGHSVHGFDLLRLIRRQKAICSMGHVPPSFPGIPRLIANNITSRRPRTRSLVCPALHATFALTIPDANV